MRFSIVALGLAMLAGLGLMHPTPAAAASDSKVVIIVGPTEGSTDNYRSAANDAYDEATKYTADVTKVYSPNATWSKVKAAVVGANVVVYLGHGNGWPSPYGPVNGYLTKDGFGLNASAGNGDSNRKYYGEPYVSTLDLAPNAVIILNRLCYASGNSEPGAGEPSQTTARKRVDNYGAGFLAGNAGAVIAEGHGSAAAVIRALFTTDGSVKDAWTGMSDFNDNVKAFESVRTPGATAYTDAEGASSGYYRSLVTQPGMTTDTVLHGVPPAPPEPYPGTPFTDIADSTFADDIAWLYNAGITTGCSATKYCPDKTVSRGQMASFLAKALSLPTASKDYFTDDNGNTHEKNINRVAAAAVTSGCGTNHFCPTRDVSRGQMASFLAKARAAAGASLASTSTDFFTDDEGLVHESNINKIAEADLTSGCATNRYCPMSTVTRGQMAAFLHRAFAD